MPHNLFEGNMYKYILTGIDIASGYKIARFLGTTEPRKVALVLEAIYKKSCVFKYPKVFQCDGAELQTMIDLTCT